MPFFLQGGCREAVIGVQLLRQTLLITHSVAMVHRAPFLGILGAGYWGLGEVSAHPKSPMTFRDTIG